MVSWKSKKQPTVSKSFVEAKYRFLSSVASEFVWLKCLLLHFEVLVEPIMVFVTVNQPSI